MSESGYSGFTGYSGFYIKSVGFLVIYSDYEVIDYSITHHEHPIILVILIQTKKYLKVLQYELILF